LKRRLKAHHFTVTLERSLCSAPACHLVELNFGPVERFEPGCPVLSTEGFWKIRCVPAVGGIVLEGCG
jgi:hypothetical protein